MHTHTLDATLTAVLRTEQHATVTRGWWHGAGISLRLGALPARYSVRLRAHAVPASGKAHAALMRALWGAAGAPRTYTARPAVLRGTRVLVPDGTELRLSPVHAACILALVSADSAMCTLHTRMPGAPLALPLHVLSWARMPGRWYSTRADVIITKRR